MKPLVLAPSIPGCPCPRRPQSQAAQRGSQQLPLSSEEEASQSRRRRQPNIGLGRANIANTVGAIAPAQVRPYTLYM